MTRPLPFDALTRRRVTAAVIAHVATDPPGPVWSVDSLRCEEVAAYATKRRPATLTARELRWIRALVAEAIATREATAFRE